jgi:hypothetical protein
MRTFVEFIDKKEREAKKHLKIVKKLLESQGMKVSDHLKADDPYIFVFNPGQNVSFNGIRVYQIGSQLAFRIQKEENTHPFGRAYSLPVEDMFEDLMSDHHKPEVAGKKVIQAVTEEVNNFFVKSAEAEKELLSSDFGGNDPMKKLALRSTGTDYSNMVFTKG